MRDKESVKEKEKVERKIMKKAEEGNNKDEVKSM